MTADYQVYYINVPIYDMSNEIYGYVVVSGYLLNEVVVEDGKRYEVVPVKKVDKLNIENYMNLESQQPEFIDGRCTNSIAVDEIFQLFDEAQEGSKERSLKVFDKKAHDESHKKMNLVRDLYGFKKMKDATFEMIKDEREINLIEIEKIINNQKKARF